MDALGEAWGSVACPKTPQEITKIQIGRKTVLLPEAQQAVAQSIKADGLCSWE